MAPPPPPSPITLAELCDEILQVQKERAAAYNTFHEGFKLYLDTSAEGPYRALMASLTSTFQALSQRMLAVEAALRDELNRIDVADTVRTLQNAEKRKLELTLAMQTMRAAVEHQRFSWQRGDDHGVGSEEHTCSHGHSHSSGGTCSSAAHEHAAQVPAEPTEAEIKGANKESYQEMEVCIETINDAIAEIQELRAEELQADG